MTAYINTKNWTKEELAETIISCQAISDNQKDTYEDLINLNTHLDLRYKYCWYCVSATNL